MNFFLKQKREVSDAEAREKYGVQLPSYVIGNTQAMSAGASYELRKYQVILAYYLAFSHSQEGPYHTRCDPMLNLATPAPDNNK